MLPSHRLQLKRDSAQLRSEMWQQLCPHLLAGPAAAYIRRRCAAALADSPSEHHGDKYWTTLSSGAASDLHHSTLWSECWPGRAVRLSVWGERVLHEGPLPQVRVQRGILRQPVQRLHPHRRMHSE